MRWERYSEIHKLKAIGLEKARVAKRLDIDVKTVTKYWEATPEQLHQMMQAGRSRFFKQALNENYLLQNGSYTILNIMFKK